jgi:ABC-type phosphate/phosphonate transport system substrate-binding protein
MERFPRQIMAKGLVGLPMYDAPELRAANRSFWQAIRKSLQEIGVKDLPKDLSEPLDLPSFWSDPHLFFGQTCGYPLTHNLCGQAKLIATPCYDSEHAEGPRYGSAIIVAQSSSIKTLIDAKNHVAAINGYDSNTGMNLFRISLARAGAYGDVFSEVIVTGSHRASVNAVANNEADIASIDVISLAHFIRFDPALSSRIRIIGYTPKTPGLPFITSGVTAPSLVEDIRRALISVLKESPRPYAVETLMLKDAVVLPRSAYDEILALEEEAKALGYPELK